MRDVFNVIPFGKWYRRPLCRRWERHFCRRANRVTTLTEGLASGMANVLGKPVTVIPNGFDPPQLGVTGEVSRDQFLILHGGSVHFPRQRPDLFLRAIDQCLRRGLIPRERLRVQFLGADRRHLQKACGDLIDRLPVEIQPRVARCELIKQQQRAAVLLVFSVPRERGVIPAKLYECLAAHRPILAVPDDHGEVSALLKRTGAGISLSNVDDIASQLARWYAEWESGRLQPPAWNRDEIVNHSRHAQTKRLAAVLDQMSE